jgi:hypothetical protein
MTRPSGNPFGSLPGWLKAGEAWLDQMAHDAHDTRMAVLSLLQLAILRALLAWSVVLTLLAAAVLAMIERGMPASVALLLAALFNGLAAAGLHLRWQALTRRAKPAGWLRGVAGLVLSLLLARLAAWPPGPLPEAEAEADPASARSPPAPATPPAEPAPHGGRHHPAG